MAKDPAFTCCLVWKADEDGVYMVFCCCSRWRGLSGHAVPLIEAAGTDVAELAVTEHERCFSLPPREKARQHSPTAIDPSAQLLASRNPVALIDSKTQR